MDEVTADAIKIIRQAREMIADPDNWSSNGTGTAIRPSSEGTRCAVVAACHARVRLRVSDASYDIAYRTLVAVLAAQGHVGTVGMWNDRPGRTHDEVIALLTDAEGRLS